MSLPSGVVTFVFSDIEGSTRLWESDPDGMADSLARHDATAHRIVAEHGGFVFKHTGDGFAAAFERVTSGLEAAAAFADAIADIAWTGPALRSRVGVHAGEAEPRDGDYYGATVTRTARIMEAGNGGQIVVSDAVRQLVRDQPPAGTVFGEAKQHRLRDLGQPLAISLLVGRGADDERRLRTLEQAPHNLPTQLTRFVGREREIKEVADLVRASRLTTLTGIGGVGKTRLSLQVAAELLGEFPDGAWLVELASLSEDSFLADAVATALAVPPDSSLDAQQRVLRHLRNRTALILVDNCEHLIDSVAEMVESILRSCPDVRVVATSREGLGVTGEALWRVPSLRVDDDAAAVELFVDRARLIQPGFSLTDDTRPVVADLCVRLDGIPLAIELATARLNVLSADQIARNLNDRFRLLTGGSRTSVERQRTLRAMMDWSHDLLSPAERTLLRRLAVFIDGFTFEAVEHVCTGAGIDSLDLLDVLSGLVEASLVSFDHEPRPRYRLLETVRQYALDRLVESGEADKYRLRHAEFFRTVARTVEAAVDDNAAGWVELGGTELGNLRGALTWMLESGRGDIALEVGCRLRHYFWRRVMHRDSLRWISSALELVEDSDPYAAIGAAFVLVDAGNIEDASSAHAILPRVERLRSMELPDAVRGELANALASFTMHRDVRRADELFREAHQLLRHAKSRRWAAPVQNRSLPAWQSANSKHREEVLGLAEEAAREGAMIHVAFVRGAFMVIDREYEATIDFVEHCSPIDKWEEGMMLVYRGHAERALGRSDEARESIARAEQLFGSGIFSEVHWESAMLHLERGELDAALKRFEVPYKQDGRIHHAYMRLSALSLWSLVAERRGQYEEAALLTGHIDSFAEEASVSKLHHDRAIIEQSRQTVRNALGDEQYEALVARGRTMTWEHLPVIRDSTQSETIVGRAGLEPATDGL